MFIARLGVAFISWTDMMMSCKKGLVLCFGTLLVSVLIAFVVSTSRRRHQHSASYEQSGIRAGGEQPATSLEQQQKLSTSNVKWIHDEGHICLRPDSVQFLETDHDTIHVQEIIGSKTYSYEMVNTEQLYKDAAEKPESIEALDTTCIDNLVGVKYNCVVQDTDEDMNDIFEMEANLVHKEADGTSTWKVGEWTVNADQNLVPRSLSSPPDIFEDEEGEAVTDDDTMMEKPSEDYLEIGLIFIGMFDETRALICSLVSGEDKTKYLFCLVYYIIEAVLIILIYYALNSKTKITFCFLFRVILKKKILR